MSGDRRPSVRLTPPPRPDAASGSRPRAQGRPRRWALALTAFGLMALVAVAGTVFVALPGWIEDRPATAATDDGDRGARPAEDPLQPISAVAGSPPPPLPSTGPPPTETRLPAAPDHEAGGEREASPRPAGERSSPRPSVGRDLPAPPTGPTELERALGAGLSAEAAGDAPAARAAFARALELDPESTPAAEGMARADEVLRSERIVAHRDAAAAHAAAERWKQALAEHEAALALDSTVEFARRGAEEARRRMTLDERLTFHLERPERLSSEAVRAEARELLARAAALLGAGPRLGEQTARLSELLARAVVPVEVVLESDELTEVTVLRVGELGRFRRWVLELLPGRYTVVGRRSGYRDVRLELVVDAGAAPEALNVRCEEKI